jgi:putative transposase
MPRPRRIAPAGVCFHVLNRGNSRRKLFRKENDYARFLAIVTEAAGRFDVDLFSWCLMPNQWHLVLRPRNDTALSRFMAWITITHVRRHHVQHALTRGRLYRGRYKSFPVEDDEYFLLLCRYVLANPLRANLVKRAERWRWSSLRDELRQPAKARVTTRRDADATPVLAEWPVKRPANWAQRVNASLTDDEEKELEESFRRDRPLGSLQWSKRLAKRLDLRQKLNPIGRPVKPLKSLSKRQVRRRKKMRTGRKVTPF